MEVASGEGEWVSVQKRTFQRWCNTYLKQPIEDLATDFSDGVAFCFLLEAISKKQLPKWNAKPRVKAQKLENCQIGLAFLKSEGLRLVAIGPEDLVEPKLKLILGLVWTIILRWQLGKGGSVDGGTGIRNELLAYVNNKLPPPLEVKNFAADWRDGRAIVALVESTFQVDLGLGPSDPALHKAEVAMTYVERNANIPKVLAPEDMVSEHVDELSVMTYVSYFQRLDRSAPATPVKSTPVRSLAASATTPMSSSSSSRDPEESLLETVLLRWVRYRQRKANLSPIVSTLADLWPASNMLPFVQSLTSARIPSMGSSEDSISWNLAQFAERERLIKTDQAARSFAQCLASKPATGRLGSRELDWLWKMVTLADLKKSSIADPEDVESIFAAVRQRLAPAIKCSFDPANFVQICLDVIAMISDDWHLREGDSGHQIIVAVSSMVLPVQLLEAGDLKREMDTRSFLLVMALFADVFEDKTRRIQVSRAEIDRTQLQLSDALKELNQAQKAAQHEHVQYEELLEKIATLENALAASRR